MGSGVTFAQLPEEEAEFVSYLQKTGDVWARAVWDEPCKPAHEPLPVAEFLQRFAEKIQRYGVVDVYLGSSDAVHHPATSDHEVIEGGERVSVVENGVVVEGRHTIVGGTKAMRTFVDARSSLFVRYKRGMFGAEDELTQSNLGFSPHAFDGGALRPKPEAFVKWGRNVLSWMKRRTPETVPVHRCNYEIRATVLVAERVRQGLKVC